MPAARTSGNDRFGGGGARRVTRQRIAKLIPPLLTDGPRDALENRGEVAGYALSAAIRIHWSADGDHSLKPRVASGRTEARNLAEVAEEVVGFVRGL